MVLVLRHPKRVARNTRWSSQSIYCALAPLALLPSAAVQLQRWADMSMVLFAYIATPTGAQVGVFFRALLERGLRISHLGKSDPPRRFDGSIENAIAMVLGGTELTGYTFGRVADRALEFDIQVHRDPGWSHSTVSASCGDRPALDLLAESAAGAFDCFITVLGNSGGEKEQPWEIVHITESCPTALRTRFIVAE